MEKHPSVLKAAGVTLVLCGLTVSAGRLAQATGYLPVLGPAPLRFQPAPTPTPTLRLALKPLAQIIHAAAAPTATPTNAPAAQTNAGASLPSDLPGTVFPESQPEAGPNLPPVISRNPAAPDLSLSPQAILGYLVPLPTNAPAGQVQLPAFVPPQAPEPPSSRATYESR